MRRLTLSLALALAVAVPASAGLGTAGAKCAFTYTPQLKRDVVDPEVDRITQGHAADYRTESPQIFTEEDGNIRLQFLYRGLDGDEIVVVIDPCSGKLIHSADFPANPEFVPCPANAPPGAWCVKPDGNGK